MSKSIKDMHRPVGLLDVDNTLIFGDSNNIIFNDSLIDSVIDAGINDVYLFTSMRVTDSKIEQRTKVIKHLESKGLKVHGVISPSDLVWHNKDLVFKFYKNLMDICSKENIFKKDEMDKRAQKLLSSDQYAALRSFGEAIPGSAFKGGKVKSLTSSNAVSLVNIVGTIRRYIKDEYSSEKAALLHAFQQHLPSWVSAIVVVDDADENIKAINQIVAAKKYKVPVSTIHARIEGKIDLAPDQHKNLFADLDNVKQAGLKYRFITLLEAYKDERISLGKSHKHYFLGSGLGKSMTQKVNAVKALISALTDGESLISNNQLSILRNGELGRKIRSFVKRGGAETILDSGERINTVREFIQEINNQNDMPELLVSA